MNFIPLLDCLPLGLIDILGQRVEASDLAVVGLLVLSTLR